MIDAIAVVPSLDVDELPVPVRDTFFEDPSVGDPIPIGITFLEFTVAEHFRP
jgi:hypothetical protein